MNRIDQLLKIQGADSTVDEIMEVYSEASEIHKQALIAMGQQPIAAHSTAASTEVVMNLSPDLSSRKENQ